MRVGELLAMLLSDKRHFDARKVLSSSQIDSSIITYSFILTYHPALVAAYQNIRDTSRFPGAKYIWRRGETLNSLSALGRKDRINLIRETTRLLSRFHLPAEWHYPMQVKLLTFILPIPVSPAPFVFIQQPREENINTYITQISNAPQIALGTASLVFTEQVKQTNLISYIKTHWKNDFAPVLKTLPKRKFLKVDPNRLALGVWLLLRKDFRENTWQEIEEALFQLDRQFPTLFGRDGLPTRDACQHLLDETRGYFNQVYPI